MFSADGIIFSFILLCVSLLGLIQLQQLYPVNHRGLLSAILILFLFARLDDALQLFGGATTYPDLLFVGSLTFLLLGPLTYHYVRVRISLKPGIRSLVLHALVVLPPLIYLLFYWWLQPQHQQVQMLTTSALYTPLNMLVWPSYGDIVLLAFLGLSIRALHQYGLQLKHWFSTVEDKNLAGLKSLLLWLMVIILAHLLWTWINGFGVQTLQNLINTLLLLSQMLFVLALVMEAIANGRHVPASLAEKQESESNQHKIYNDAQLAQSAQLIEQVVYSRQLYLDPNLTLSKLAKVAGHPQKRISQALNQKLQQSFYDFINRARIEHAQQLIRTHPQFSLLDIAMQSGFNSKSVFNNAFRKISNTTPSGYKKALLRQSADK